MAKQPAIFFYIGDWKKDSGVQALSFEERGVWFELLLMMFESVERGKLLFSNRRPMTKESIARSLGLDNQKCAQILDKLLEYGVCSQDQNTKAYYSRRMVRDAAISASRSKCGAMGGNPNLKKADTEESQDLDSKERLPAEFNAEFALNAEFAKAYKDLFRLQSAKKRQWLKLIIAEFVEFFHALGLEESIRRLKLAISNGWKELGFKVKEKAKESEISVEDFRAMYKKIHVSRGCSSKDFIYSSVDRKILKLSLEELREKNLPLLKEIQTRWRDPKDLITQQVLKEKGEQ